MNKILPTSAKRFLLNLRSNRWWIFFGSRFLLHSPRHKLFLSQKWTSHGVNLAEPSIRVYVRLSQWFSAPSSLNLDHSGFVISHLGRFGNAIREIVGAYAKARSLSLGNLVIIGPSGFKKGGNLAHPGIRSSTDKISVWIGEKKDHGSQTLNMLISWKRGCFPVTPGSGNPAWSAAPGLLGLAGPYETLGKNTLVIHLRGGDVFGVRDAPEYGQPPLGFYMKVLAHRAWERVIVVHEDDRNPVLQGLIEHCQNEAIPCRQVSGALRDDLAILLAAENFVASRGTFGPAIAGLSQRVNTIYYFEDKFSISPPKTGITLFRAEDTSGEYRETVLRSNWQHSPSQLSLMLSYDESKIVITEGIMS